MPQRAVRVDWFMCGVIDVLSFRVELNTRTVDTSSDGLSLSPCGDRWTFKSRLPISSRFCVGGLVGGGGGEVTLMDEPCGVSLHRSPNLIDSCTLHLITGDIRARVARRAATCRAASSFRSRQSLRAPLISHQNKMAAVGKRGVYVFIPRDSDVWLHIIKAIDSGGSDSGGRHWSISGRHVAAYINRTGAVTSQPDRGKQLLPDQLLCGFYISSFFLWICSCRSLIGQIGPQHCCLVDLTDRWYYSTKLQIDTSQASLFNLFQT